MFDQLASILAVCTITLAAFGLGRPILRGLRVGQEDRLSVGVWSIALGLIAAGLVLTGLGLVGALYTSVIGVLTVAACFLGLGGLVFRRYNAPEQDKSSPENVSFESPEELGPAPCPPPAGWMLRGALLLAGVACLGSLIGALAPPTAGDALCYHLALPKTFLAEHKIVYLPYSDNSTFPLLAEMWYLWGLALDGGVCAQLIHWELGILLALATVLLALPIVGRPWAWIAGAVVVLVPGVNNQMTAPLNDVALAALGTLALAACWRAAVNDESRRWFVLAGLAAGGALATKYVALLLAAAVAPAWLWVMYRQAARRWLLLEGAAVVCIVALSVGGVWYVRAAWHRGNPVFPFFSEVFSPAGTEGNPGLETFPQGKSPLGRGPVQLALSPWQVTIYPEQFGGRAHQPGVLLLAALPGVLIARRLRGLGTLLAVAGAYWVLWYLLRQNVRFLFAVIPLLAVAVVWVWIEIRRFPLLPRAVTLAALTGILAATAVLPLVRSHAQLAVALGLQSREDYLLLKEPSFLAADVANRLLRPDTHILSQDYRAFYFNCRVTRENVYRRYTHYDRQIAEPGDFTRQLRRAGFTHLLLAETVAGCGVQYDPTLSRLADAQLRADPEALLVLADYQFRDSDGTTRRYRLVMLR